MCPFCGSKMALVIDTLLCPKCDFNEIYELNAFVKYDLEEVKKHENVFVR